MQAGQEIFIRWLDINDIAGSDHGIAVDDLTVTFTPQTVGPATQVRVETAAGGGGSVASSQSLAAGSSVTVYAIARDATEHLLLTPMQPDVTHENERSCRPGISFPQADPTRQIALPSLGTLLELR